MGQWKNRQKIENNMVEPSITVVIPLYNKAATIRSTIQTVLAQNYDNYEIIVVDDGSTDGGGEIVASAANHRLQYYRIGNSGPSAARNFGIGKARNDWILFLDADDFLLPGSLTLFGTAVSNYPEADVFVANYFVEKGGERQLFSSRYASGKIQDCFKEWFLKRLEPCAGTVMFRKKVFQKYQYKQNLRRYEDVDLMFRVFNDCKVVRLKQPTMVYRQDFSAASKATTQSFENDYLGHLESPKGSFWRRASMYQMLLEAEYTYGDRASVYSKERSNLINRLIYSIATRIRRVV
ncbi:MAG: glycosyltransferase [Bacteroidales bacterium]|nr:glycosyltransferase [Bacteroidales bacterium]